MADAWYQDRWKKLKQIQIPSHDLYKKIPEKEDPSWWVNWIKLAFTIKDYEVPGGSQACDDLSNKFQKIHRLTAYLKFCLHYFFKKELIIRWSWDAGMLQKKTPNAYQIN